MELEEFLSEKYKLDIEYDIHDEAILDLLQEVKSEIKYLDVLMALVSIFVLLKVQSF